MTKHAGKCGSSDTRTQAIQILADELARLTRERAYVYRESDGDLPMEKKTPKELDAIVDKVLGYRPKARSKPAVQRKRRRTILEKKRRTEKEK